MVDVGIIGAAGYAGIETVRWVLGHQDMRLVAATSSTHAGTRIDGLYPGLAGATELTFTALDLTAFAKAAQVAFLAVPHTAALEIVPGLLDAGLTVIDMSADFRLSDPVTYQDWYGVEHSAPGLLGKAVYGLPELDRSQLPGASLVAVPGCYPTATILAALPVLESGLALGSRIVVDAKSGVSGAGRTPSPTTHFVQANESCSPYKVGNHRHTPEMEQALSQAAGREVSVIFTPHLVPMSRGLLSTVYLDVEKNITTEQVVEFYRGRYHEEPFVHVCKAGSMPTTAEVRGTNRAAIGVHVDERTNTLVVACAIDNVGKGSAGQAVQCANAVLGLDERTGLDRLAPVV